MVSIKIPFSMAVKWLSLLCSALQSTSIQNTFHSLSISYLYFVLQAKHQVLKHFGAKITCDSRFFFSLLMQTKTDLSANLSSIYVWMEVNVREQLQQCNVRSLSFSIVFVRSLNFDVRVFSQFQYANLLKSSSNYYILIKR